MRGKPDCGKARAQGRVGADIGAVHNDDDIAGLGKMRQRSVKGLREAFAEHRGIPAFGNNHTEPVPRRRSNTGNPISTRPAPLQQPHQRSNASRLPGRRARCGVSLRVTYNEIETCADEAQSQRTRILSTVARRADAFGTAEFDHRGAVRCRRQQRGRLEVSRTLNALNHLPIAAKVQCSRREKPTHMEQVLTASALEDHRTVRSAPEDGYLSMRIPAAHQLRVLHQRA